MSRMTGRLIGVGVGPGDPELLTVKALKALQSAEVVAYFAKAGNQSNARRIVEGHLNGADELPLLYPVTTEIPKASKALGAASNSFRKSDCVKPAGGAAKLRTLRRGRTGAKFINRIHIGQLGHVLIVNRFNLLQFM